MTNHPHRARDEDDDLAAEALDGASAIVPAEDGIPPQGSAEIPAHTGNGVPPGLRPNAAKLIGQAVAEALAQSLPNALAMVLSQVPVQAMTQQHLCATCLTARFTWENAHRAEMEAAMAAAAAAAGLEPGDPQAGRLDLTVFLPPHLRPGEPQGIMQIGQAVTAVNGTELCPAHIPGVQAGRASLLVATTHVSPAMLGQLAGTGP